MSFGRSLFTEVETDSKLASIVSQRGLKLIAGDIERGARGTLHTFDKSTQSMVMPPYFNPMINLTNLDSYDALNVDGVNAKITWGRFLDDVASRMLYLMDTIDGRYELQCWQSMLLGYVTLNNGDNITYGRKSGSLVDPGAGNYWADANVDPYLTTFERGSTWLNETGKMPGNTINVIFGKSAWSDYTNNAAVKARDLKFNNQLEVLANKAIVDSTGKIFKGSTTIGAFNYQFFVYNDFFQDENGTVFKFMDDKKIIMIPDVTSNVLTYTAVPQLKKLGQPLTKGKFVVWNAIDPFQDAEFMGVKSAGLPLFGAVDQVYTEKVKA